MALNINYNGQDFRVDFSRIEVDDLEKIEDYTGLPGASFLEGLSPTNREGTPLTGEQIKSLNPADIRFSPSTKVIRAVFWLMTKQSGYNVGEISSVNPEYQTYLVALIQAFAQEAGVAGKIEPVTETSEFDAFDPKAKETEPAEPNSGAGMKAELRNP